MKILPTALDTTDQLDLEVCRALFEKDPDRLIELLSEWLEAHELTTSSEFQLPDYLRRILYPEPSYRFN